MYLCEESKSAGLSMMMPNPILLIRASFSQERLSYDARTATVVYTGKDDRQQKRFEALKWRKRA
jgi:hypothetical protein